MNNKTTESEEIDEGEKIRSKLMSIWDEGKEREKEKREAEVRKKLERSGPGGINGRLVKSEDRYFFFPDEDKDIFFTAISKEVSIRKLY